MPLRTTRKFTKKRRRKKFFLVANKIISQYTIIMKCAMKWNLAQIMKDMTWWIYIKFYFCLRNFSPIKSWCTDKKKFLMLHSASMLSFWGMKMCKALHYDFYLYDAWNIYVVNIDIYLEYQIIWNVPHVQHEYAFFAWDINWSRSKYLLQQFVQNGVHYLAVIFNCKKCITWCVQL